MYWRIWIFLAAFYLPPLVRNGLFFLNDRSLRLVWLNRPIGFLEKTIGWWRDGLVGLFAFVCLTLQISHLVQYQLWWQDGLKLLPVIAAMGLIWYCRWWRWHAMRDLLQLLVHHPNIHPEEFFNHVNARFGFLHHPVSSTPEKTVNLDHLNFRVSDRNPVFSVCRLLRCGLLTSFCVRLAYHAFLWLPPHERGAAASSVSLLYATRMAQIAEAEVIVENHPSFEKMEGGKQIVLLNHRSFFDFAFSPLLLCRFKKNGHAANFFPRYLVAKDHFKDSLFLGKMLGFAKLLEAWGMIFVDRTTKDGKKGREVVRDSVRQLLKGDTPVALYPQGTRAHGQYASDGSRWDAGYFCVGGVDRLKRERGHLKKGFAFLALETALALKKEGVKKSVWLLPIGIEGVGTTCPRNSFRVRTQTIVCLRAADPILVQAVEESKYAEQIESIFQTVDQTFQKLLEIPTRLERRFLTDLRDVVHSHAWEDVAVALRAWRDKDDLLYVLLDFLYATKPVRHRHFLNELAKMLVGDVAREEFLELRNRIVSSL